MAPDLRNMDTRTWSFILTVIAQIVVIVWWGSRITTQLEGMQAQMTQAAAERAALTETLTDLRIRIAVQEAMSGWKDDQIQP